LENTRVQEKSRANIKPKSFGFNRAASPPDAIPCFQQSHIGSGMGKLHSCGETAWASTNYNDMPFCHTQFPYQFLNVDMSCLLNQGN
jgi:hypothetical protein